MRNLIAKLAWKLNWKTWYHIAYSFPVAGGGVATCDCVVEIRPWLRHGKIYSELQSYLMEHSAPHGCEKTPNILSITKIGA